MLKTLHMHIRCRIYLLMLYTEAIWLNRYPQIPYNTMLERERSQKAAVNQLISLNSMA